MKKEEAEEILADDGGPIGVWKLLVAFGIILVIMVGFYAFNQYRANRAHAQNQYNGFDFAQAEGGLWVTRIEIGKQPYDIPFYYHPRDLTDIPVDKSAIEPIFGAPRQVFISLDPDAGAQPVIAGVEISRITGNKYNIFNLATRGALSRPEGDNLELPVINCQNSSADRVVIQFVPAQQNVIARSERYPYCVLLNYMNASESVRVADKYAYMLLKVV